ncbi:hypothetical protein [Streptomyces sp. NBC_00470]|uniref:hypothetical protein n=1 Tax=Streptomyces sp. NBC_00470 TaxID=2975753 RepID=UPI0030DFDDAC
MEDRDSDIRRRLDPSVRRRLVGASPATRLQTLRAGFNRSWHDTRPEPPKRRRQVRYVAYALTANPTDDLDRVRRHVSEAGATVKYELTDVDPHNTPQDRPGWAKACRLVASGRADGIAVANRTAISEDDDAYRAVVTWLGTRPALLLVVTPEGIA